MGFGQFADPRRYDGIKKTNPQTSDNSSAEEHVGVDTARHESSTENAEERADQDTALAANLVPNPSYNRD